MAYITRVTGDGYSPIKDYNGWRLAALLPASTNQIDTFSIFGMHNTTDEVFVILQGEAHLITAGNKEIPGEILVQKMEQKNLYTVEEKEWHIVILDQDAVLLIIENSDTTDSLIFEISQEQKIFIKNKINNC